MSPVVSVCIANYNGVGLIDACIESVRGQDCAFPVEIIVHDDASNDGSVAYIRTRYPGVRLIEGAANVGFCIANNRMAAVARGEYLLLLNNDAELLPDALQVMHDEAERLDHPAILTLPQFDFDTGELIDRGCLLDPFCNPIPNLDPSRRDVAMVIGACLWVPKTLWNGLGGFPEWFGSIGEDLYLCCRARLAGHPVRALGVSGYHHRVGQSFGGGKARAGQLATTFRRRALSERNKTFVMFMTYPTPFMELILPLHLAVLLIEGCLLALLRRQPAFLTKIYLPALKGLLEQRRPLQDLRRKITASRRLPSTGFFSVFVPLPHKLQMFARHGLPAVT